MKTKFLKKEPLRMLIFRYENLAPLKLNFLCYCNFYFFNLTDGI